MTTTALKVGRAATRVRLQLPHVGDGLTALEAFLVPGGTRAEGATNDVADRTRSLRLVIVIALVSLVLFIPSLIIAGVPGHLWLTFTAAVVATGAVVGWSLLVVAPDSNLWPVAVIADALAIAGLGSLIGDYFHQIALLYAIVVVGHTAVHGYRAAMLMVLCGSILVPVGITAGQGLNVSDAAYAFFYLACLATIPWIHIRLRIRGTAALSASATRYRELVERVPAIVYTVDAGSDGRCQYVSPRVEDLLGFPVEAWTSDPGFWLSRVHPDDRDRVAPHLNARQERSAGHSDAIEYRMVDKDGAALWVRDEASVSDSGADPATRWTGFLTDVTDRKTLEAQLQHQAFHDPLTELPNRSLFADRVGHALDRTSRTNEPLAVLFLDIDDFKTINDAIGHEAGDELLVAVAEALRTCLRPMDTAARFGGDEFAVLLEDLTDTRAAQDVADRILAALAHPITIDGREVVISASIGIALSTGGDDSVTEIMRNADGAMYSAKRLGKGRHETFAPVMREAVVQRLELTAEMRRALELDEFTVHYQPVVRLSDGAITGFEALARWNHSSRGLILPGDFIATAEETGQIVDIGRLVLDRACQQARAWQDAYPDQAGRMMSVNVSARQFRDPALCDWVAESLANAGLHASGLTLEITESAIMEDTEDAIERLARLKALGVSLAIDDFGTGYSSLSYLRRLPVDTLKIDKSFVDEITSGGQALALARVILSIGETLRLDTVAEGVELSAQASMLKGMGCEVAQGFHFARPMAADDAGAMLSRRQHTTLAQSA